MNLVLSSYPLTRDSLIKIGEIDPYTTLTLSELRTLSLAGIIRSMRATPITVLIVVVQEPSERAVLPLMLTLAGLADSRVIKILDFEVSAVAEVSRLKALFGVIGAISATITGLFSIAWLFFSSFLLNSLKARNFDTLKNYKTLYLKSNLMLGVKAGGSIGHIAGVANELLKRDPETTILAPEPPPMVRPDARFVSIETLKSYGVPAEINHFRFNWNCIKSVSAILAVERFDLIYQRLSLGNLSGVLLSRRFNIPLILEYNGSEVWISGNWGRKLKFKKLASMIEDCCLRHAHRIVTVSQVLADELQARGIPKNKIIWYPNCIDPTVFDPDRFLRQRGMIRKQLNVKCNELVVLFLGTFGAWHGAEVLGEAVKRYFKLPIDNGYRLKFLFVGDGFRLNAVKNDLGDIIATGGATFTGLIPQSEAPHYLAAADIFVSPHVPSTDGSRFFGSPTKLFEYMAMCRPIVASNLEQIADVLRPAIASNEISPQFSPKGNEVAVLARPGDPDDLLKALIFLKDRPDIRLIIAESARKICLNKFTWNHHVNEFIRVL